MFAEFPDHIVEAGDALVAGVLGLERLDGGKVDMLEPRLLDKASQQVSEDDDEREHDLAM